MNRLVAYLPVLFLALVTHPVAGQAPKAGRTVIGKWELESVTIDGVKAEENSKQLSDLLKHAGGVKIGMLYRIEEKTIVMDDHRTEYDFKPKEMTIGIEYPTEKGEDGDLIFDVKFLDKNKLQLNYRDKRAGKKDRKVAMVFTPEV